MNLRSDYCLVIDLPGFRPITGTGGGWLILWMEKTVMLMGWATVWNAKKAERLVNKDYGGLLYTVQVKTSPYWHRYQQTINLWILNEVAMML